MNRSALAELRARQAELEHPRLAKTSAPSIRERSENRATDAFRAGIEAARLSQRATARRLGVCERLVRDYLSGARQLPAWAPLALPRDGQIAYLRALTDAVPDSQEENEETALSATGTGG